MVLGLYTHELRKSANNRIVISFLSQTLCETVVFVNQVFGLGGYGSLYNKVDKATDQSK